MEATKRKLPTNPAENANWLSKLFLLWTFKVFKNGWEKDLEVDDLYETLQSDKTVQLGDRLDRNWKSQCKSRSSGNPRLYKSILRTFWEDFVWLPVLTFISFFGCRGFQPFLLGRLLKYFRKNSNMTYDEVLLYAAGLVALNFIHITVVTWIFMKSKHLGMKMRISLCSLAYRKVLSLSHAALCRAEIGNLVNFLSNDLNRCDYIGVGYSAILVTPGICGLLVFMLWREYQWPGIIGFSIIIGFLLLQGVLGKIVSILRLKAAGRTDKRIKLINEVVTGVQVIKIRGWEQRFSQMVAVIRRLELTFIRYTLNMRGIFLTFKLIDTKLVVFSVMLSAALLYGS